MGKQRELQQSCHGAIDNNPNAGSKLIEQLLSKVRASGGFREQSANFVGSEAILNAISTFDADGYELSKDGDIRPKVLESLKGRELTLALQTYARRAQKGAQDAALLSGTGKDLLEATAAHILQTKLGLYSSGANFEGLLGQTYMALGLTVPEQAAQPSKSPTKALERAMFQTACAINRLRNKEGTGHGRPWLSSITNTEATAAIEMVGTIAGFLLSKLDKNC